MGISPLKILIILIFLLGCSQSTDFDPSDKLLGLYKSIKFLEPGPRDGGTNVAASGGYLSISFISDNHFTAELFIPSQITSSYPAGINKYMGSWALKNKTLVFYASEFFIDSLKWDMKLNKLETHDLPSRGEPFKIILVRKNIVPIIKDKIRT